MIIDESNKRDYEYAYGHLKNIGAERKHISNPLTQHQIQSPISSYPSSASSHYSDNYPEVSKMTMPKRNSGFGTLAHNILGTASPTVNVERAHSSTIK